MAATGRSNVIGLYRCLLKQIRLLPQEAQLYYKNYVRQGYSSHSDETDPERIQQIVSRAKEDAKWVLQKYGAMKKDVT